MYSSNDRGDATASSKCSGAKRFESAAASCKSPTEISAPRLRKDASIISRRGMSGSSALNERRTASRHSSDVAIQTACAISSCSACDIRSSAIQSGSTLPSAMIKISEGPAIMSMPTLPKTCRFASAT